MGDFAVGDPVSGNVNSILSVNNTADFRNDDWFKSADPALLAVELPQQYSREQILNDVYYAQEEEAWKSRSSPPAGWYYWSSDRNWKIDTDGLMIHLRSLRDNRLAITDWTQMADSALSNSKKAEWATYRQALRDLPANLPSDFAGPEDAPWPTEPS